MILKLLLVFGLGMVGLWEGIPAGFVVGLPPVVTAIVSAAGSTLATVLVLLLGERLQSKLLFRRRLQSLPGQTERLIDRVWRRYGIVGLGLLAPCITGAPIGIALGLVLRAQTGRLLAWMIAGIVLWSGILTALGVYGSSGIRKLITG